MAIEPFVQAVASGPYAGNGAAEVFGPFDTRGCQGLILTSAVTALGNGKSYVDSAALSFPVTISAASNDQFEYNELEYLVPAGVYASAAALATALNSTTNDEDNAGATFPSLVVVSASPTANALRFTSVATGVNVLAYGTGAEHDALATLGITDGWTQAHTQAAAADGTAADQTITIQGVDPVSGNTWTILADVSQASVSTHVLQVGAGLNAVNNSVANSLLPLQIKVSIAHTLTNGLTRAITLQLVD
jgi:hypothetical protein